MPPLTILPRQCLRPVSELARTAKKPAIRATSTSVNYQTIVDGVMEALELHNQSRMTEVNAAQVTNPTANTGHWI